MRPEDRELSYLWDMREAAREIVIFMKDVKFADFEKKQTPALRRGKATADYR